MSHYYYYVSYQGDVLGLLTTEGELAATYLYDAWGNLLEDELTLIGSLNPIRYRSYYYDSDLSLYYLQSRYYDSTTGRFISTDSTDYLDPNHLQGMNLYTYGLNNPVMHTDPSGYFPFLLIFLALTAVVGGIIGAYKAHNDAISLGKTGSSLVWATLSGAVIGVSAGLMIGGIIAAVACFPISAIYGFHTIVPFIGYTVTQTFAIGALATIQYYQIVAPILGQESLEPIEMPSGPNNVTLYPREVHKGFYQSMLSHSITIPIVFSR